MLNICMKTPFGLFPGFLVNRFHKKIKLFPVFLCLILISQMACQSPTEYREDADRVAHDIIQEKFQDLGEAETFSIERPSDILRRRLLEEQDLVYAGPVSLGADRLDPIEHWPEENYPLAKPAFDPITNLGEPNEPVKIALMQALQIGACNSFEYQTRKEGIFREALALDLERNNFRTIFNSQVDALLQTDLSGDDTTGMDYSGIFAVSQTLPSGVELTASLAASLAHLLTMNQASAYGLAGDATVSVPLLRGSGRHIVTEPLIQAERNVLYEIYQFKRFRQTFAVNIASVYLGVLQQLDEIENNEENYRGLVLSARRARRLADAGRLTEVQVDQAVQEELRARNRWISAVETYKSRLDSLKNLLGLPTDAHIELDRSELERLAEYSERFTRSEPQEQNYQSDNESLSADTPVMLDPPEMENAGPLEIDESRAIKLAFDNRYDFIVALGGVYDAQRAVVVLADRLGAELNLLGSVSAGGSRTISTAGSDDVGLEFDEGVYSALMTLDLPFERTAERNAYRNSLITLEQEVRDVQILEDQIKSSIRNNLRNLLESRESLLIQAMSVDLAQKRVRSTNLFLEAGRAQIRDLLEAQEALLSAQNSLTSAIINYRISELELQRDIGVLHIDEKGIWQEYSPGES